jgi:hypothetical protein
MLQQIYLSYCAAHASLIENSKAARGGTCEEIVDKAITNTIL